VISVIFGKFKIALLGFFMTLGLVIAPHPRTACILTYITKRVPDVCCHNVPLDPIDPRATILVPELTPCYAKHSTNLVGVGNPYAWPVVPRACIHNELVATRNRTLKLTNPGDKLTIMNFFAFVVNNNYFMMPEFPNYPIPSRGKRIRPDFEMWNRRFPLHQQHRHRAALIEHHHGHTRNQPQVSSCFVKRENTLKGTMLGITPFSPRAIQSRYPYYQARVGPVIWAISNIQKTIWSTSQTHHIGDTLWKIIYTAGLNANQVGQAYLDFVVDPTLDYLMLVMGDDNLLACRTATGTIFIELDQARFDAHVLTEHLMLEHRKYEWFGVSQTVMQLLKSEFVTEGVTHSGIKYKVPATRRSGDPTTSEGNTHLNGCMIIYACMKHLLHRDAQLHPNIINEISDLGMTPTAIIHYEPEAMSFCSSYFWHALDNSRPGASCETIVLGPKIGRVISKAFWNMSDIPDRIWLKAVCIGYSHDVAHIPILRTIVSTLLRLTDDVVLNDAAIAFVKKESAHRNLNMKVLTISPLIWHQMHEIYGVNQEEILDIEAHIASIQRLPVELSGPFIQRIVERDVEVEPPLGPAPNPYSDFATHMDVGSVAHTLQSVARQYLQPDGLLSVCVISPIWEELVKHKFRFATYAIIAIEAGCHLALKGLPGLYHYAPTILLHLVAARLSLKKGTLLHAGWNTYAYLGPWFATTFGGG